MTEFMARLGDAIDHLIEELEFTEHGLVLFNRRPVDLATTPRTDYPGQYGRANLTQQLATVLYTRFYCREPEFDEVDAGLSGDLADGFTSANQGCDGFSEGWQMAAEQDDHVLLVRGVSQHLAKRHELRDAGSNANREAVAVFRPRESLTAQPHYYYAFGHEIADRFDLLTGLRIYLAIQPEHAAEWVELVTTMFAQHRIPFGFKLPRSPSSYRRADAGVIYLPWKSGAFALAQLQARMPLASLRPIEPHFTRRIADGLAIAENPPGGQSFGVNRIRLLANALMLGWDPVKGRFETDSSRVARMFRAHGIDPAKPWLNPGNHDLVLPSRTLNTSEWPVSRNPVANPVCFGAATAIAWQLVRDAISSDDRCTWSGMHASPTTQGVRRAFMTASADFYSGTAGIALFLARASASTGFVEFQRTALKAMRHALANSGVNSSPPGGYTGLAGTAFGLAHSAAALDCDEAQSLALQGLSVLQRQLVRADAVPPADDLLGGKAGIILAILGLPRTFASDELMKLAVVFGDKLCARAIGNSLQHWPPDETIAKQPLCGLAHGTAGIALALARLGVATGFDRFVRAGRAAIAYEIAAFDPKIANWPDHRIAKYGLALMQEQASMNPSSAMVAWCNGASGSMHAALEILGTDDWTGKQAALCTLRSAIEHALARPIADCSLCHGLAGNIEILHDFARSHGRIDLITEAQAAAQTLANRYGQSYWPGGIDTGRESAGLMLGNAGVGHFFLRMNDPTLPSVLSLCGSPSFVGPRIQLGDG